MSLDDNHDIKSDHDATSFTKYFRMFVFSSPVNNLRTYSHGLRRIFEELEKT